MPQVEMAIGATTPAAETIAPSPALRPALGPRHQLTYEQWVELLAQEAAIAAEQHPAQLHILAGDSISLWFPPELLPPDFTWLNQGISGETSAGLLRRLHLFDHTQPQIIFVMIGINDLIRGVAAETLLANYQAILAHLKASHPQSRIVVQSILPHAGSRALQARHPAPPWAARLIEMSNDRIRALNRQLAAIAQAAGGEFLNLHPHFTDAAGNLVSELSTDGLHLSRRGYAVWRLHLDRFLAASERKPVTPADRTTR